MPLSDELNDVQGLIVRGYGALRGARFLLLAVRDAAAAGAWLAKLDVRDSVRGPSADDTAINVAFTPAGLQAFGVDANSIATFAREFREGMTGTAHRRRTLGDAGASDPDAWRWGGPHNPPVHMLLALYAANDAAVAALSAEHVAQLPQSGLTLIDQLDTLALPDSKEHFGFRDGIAKTTIAGLHTAAGSVPDVAANDAVAAGEFVFGYDNAYGQLPPSPSVPFDAGLPALAGRGDLGRNGSYLVFRQLSQDVSSFWQHLDRAANGDADTRVELAAKMVGRWPGGAPLAKSPARDDPAMATDDDFMYYRSGDPHGLRCPIGAHIRRSNPRDALDPVPGSDRSIEVGKRHRILRRGRTYGTPLAATLDPAAMLAAADDGSERGLHFLCFNAHLGRQFEFIQHTWVNNPKFDGLYADDDPLLGARGDGGAVDSGTFTIQAEPVRKRITDLPRFVQVRGGAYFFMPGLRALRYIAGQRGRSPT